GMQMPTWGISSAPLVDGDRLIAIVGGQPDAMVMAFDKITGKELWRALPSDTEQGYSQPVIFEAGKIRQLIIWRPTAVVALDPATGKGLLAAAIPGQFKHELGDAGAERVAPAGSIIT